MAVPILALMVPVLALAILTSAALASFEAGNPSVVATVSFDLHMFTAMSATALILGHADIIMASAASFIAAVGNTNLFPAAIPGGAFNFAASAAGFGCMCGMTFVSTTFAMALLGKAGGGNR